PLALGVAGLSGSVAVWIGCVIGFAVGVGIVEVGALAMLLDTVGAERMVLAMVVWSQAWAVGYAVGPAIAGAVAQGLGYGAVGLVPLAAAGAVAALFPRAIARRAV